MGLDVPVGEDGQRIVAGIPDLGISGGQDFRQRCAHLHAGQLPQELIQGQVFVGEAVDGF